MPVLHLPIFAEESESDWTNPRAVIDNGYGTGIILVNDVYIEAPLVHVNKHSILNDEKVTISTSDYRGQGDGHFETHWMVTDKNGKVKWASMYDKVNLTSIEVLVKDLNISDLNTANFMAIHRTATSVESAIGITTLELSELNFEILSNMQRVLPFTPYTIKLEKVDDALPTNIVKVEVLDISNVMLYSKKIFTDTLSIDLPSTCTIPGVDLYIDIYATVDGEPKRKRKIMHVLPNYETDSTDIDYTYKDKMELVNTLDITIPNSIKTRELFNKEIYIPIKDKTDVGIYKFDRNNNTINVIDNVDDLSLLGGDNDGTLVWYLSNNKILIDTLNGDGDPVFMLYSYDTYRKRATLEHTITRGDETECLGYRANYVFINDSEIVYVPKGSSIPRRFNIYTGDLVMLPSIPIKADYISVMSTMNNRIEFIGGDGVTSWLYNVTTKTYQEGISIPEDYRSRELVTIALINGDYLIMKKSVDSDERGGYLYYDTKNGTVKELGDEYQRINIDGVIDLRTGERLIVSNGENDSVMLYRYS